MFFISKKRFNTIMGEKLWEKERESNRERELWDLWNKVHSLEKEIDFLKGKHDEEKDGKTCDPCNY